MAQQSLTLQSYPKTPFSFQHYFLWHNQNETTEIKDVAISYHRWKKNPTNKAYENLTGENEACTVEYVKVKVYVYSSDVPNTISRLYISYPQVLELALWQSHLPGDDAAQFTAAGPIYIAPIFVPPSTHCCRVDRGDVDMKLAQSFYTWLAFRELNPRSLDLWSNALTTQPRTPQVN